MCDIAGITVVIISFNTVALLRECLDSIRRFAGELANIVVVDNASTDGSADMVRSEFPEVQLLANQENLGFPRAVNQGVQAQETPYYLVLNSDIRLTETTLPPLLAHMSARPRAGIIAPAQRTPQSDLLLIDHAFPSLGGEFARNLLFADIIRYRVRGEWLAKQHDKPARVDWVMGAALFIRREMIEDIGYMDENVFMYGEEYDWAYRAHLAGWETWLLPDAVIIHHKSASADKAFNTRRLAMVARSDYYFRAKHFGWAKLPLFVLMQVLGSMLRILLLAILFFAHPDEARRQWQEHVCVLQISFTPAVYRWIRSALNAS